MEAIKTAYAVPLAAKKTGLLHLLSVFVILCICASNVNGQDPFTRLKQAADKEPVAKQELGKVTVAESDPKLRSNKKSPVPFKPFEMQDQTGKKIDPNETADINGQKMTAKEFFDKLNEIEKNLNAQGHSLRNKQSVLTNDVVTPSSELDGKVPEMSKSIGPFKSEKEVESFSSTSKQVGGLKLKPFDEYSEAEKKKVKETKFSTDAAGNLSIIGLWDGKLIDQPTKIIYTDPPLKTISEVSTKDWGFGSTTTFRAGIRGDLIRAAKIYKFNPQSPGKSMSEFKVNANGKVYGALFGYSMDLLSATAEFFAPADSSKSMTAKVQISIAGITVLNLSQSLMQSKSFTNSLQARSIDRSFPITIPICCGISFSGKIGIKGSAGFQYGGSIYRTFVSLNAQPMATLSGYAEAGISIGGVAKLGVGGQLTFIQGYVPLSSYVGIWSQNASQIVVAYTYYLGYNLSMLKGRLYGYADICAPWVGCYRLGEVNFYSWTGYTATGTIAQGTYSYVLANI